MIDWPNLFFNALWIVGLAIALAAASYASWEASIYKDRLSARLRRTAILGALNLAGLLFALGLAGSSGRLFEKLLWLLLAAIFLFQIVAALRAGRAGKLPEER
jgi:hypothetical protein